MYDNLLPQMVEKDYGVWVHSRPLPAKRIGLYQDPITYGLLVCTDLYLMV